AARVAVASWLSEIAQKNGISVKSPFLVEVPSCGVRNPDWRSRRMAAAKKGKYGMTGSDLTQRETSVPYKRSSRSAVAEPRWNDHDGGSSSHVVNTPRWTRYRLSPRRSKRSPERR